jgi:glyoxylate reductase
MERMPELRVISNFGVGCDHIDLEGARRLGIPVGNTPGVLDATTADMTFTLLMAAARNVVRGDHFARGPDFIEYDPSFLLGQEVAGSIMGIVGLGRIGYQVARRATGFDMKVIYHNRGPNRRAEEELSARYVPYSVDEARQYLRATPADLLPHVLAIVLLRRRAAGDEVEQSQLGRGAVFHTRDAEP